MERLKRLCVLLTVCLFFLGAATLCIRRIYYCEAFPYYPTDCSYTPERVRTLFAEEREIFDRLARIMLANDDAYENGHPEYETTFQMLGSTYGKYAKYFSEGEVVHIKDFFSDFRPYSIYRRYDYAGFVFICQNGETEPYSVSLLYSLTDTHLRPFKEREALGDGWYYIQR